MFYHAFEGYMQYAFPLDELRPLSCSGEDSLGGYALTLVMLPSSPRLGCLETSSVFKVCNFFLSCVSRLIHWICLHFLAIALASPML